MIVFGVFGQLLAQYPHVNIWIGFGMGKNYKEFHMNSIFKDLGRDTCLALPGFHAFTGCDTTSQFQGKGKKTAWAAWKTFPEVTSAFIAMTGNHWLSQDSSAFSLMERYTCVLYDKATDLSKVNELRKYLFSHKCLSMKDIPPTQAALLQHSNRAVYQASIWSNSLQAIQAAPSPKEYGWVESDQTWTPLWTRLPEAAKVCRELLKCGCKAVPLCSRNCRCKNAGLPCTALCKCSGECKIINSIT